MGTQQNFDAYIENSKFLTTEKTQEVPDGLPAQNSEVFTKAQYYLVTEGCDESIQTTPAKPLKEFSIDYEKYSELSGRTKNRLRLADSKLQ
jgi:hypothetical protein